MTSAPITIALDVGPLHGHRTGVGVAVEALTAALGRRDDIELLPYVTSFRAGGVPGQRRLPIPGIVASHLWSRSERPRADRWLGDADLVHGTNHVAPPTSLPTVVTVHDCWFLEHPELVDPVVRRAGRTLRRAIDRGAWVHAVSDATADAARRALGTDRIVTIRQGPPPPVAPLDQLARPEIAQQIEGRPFVVAIASEERRKDLPLLIAAFALLEVSDAHLVLAGAPGNDTAAIERALTDLPDTVADRVHRLGVVDDDAKQWLLRQASVLAYPSLDEGFGFPILEAQSAGTPVVASDTGSIAEIAGDGITLVSDRDPASFAQALTEVLTGGFGRLGQIEAGHRNLARFDWDRTADDLVELYRRVLEEAA